jgi:hypothetical protein
VLGLVAASWAMAAVAIAASLPESPALWVEWSSELLCPPPDDLLSALRMRLGDELVHTGPAPREALVLRVDAHGPRGARALLKRGTATILERTIVVGEGECAGLAQTLALVTEAWLPLPATPTTASPEAPTTASPEAPTPRDQQPAPPRPTREPEAAPRAEPPPSGAGAPSDPGALAPRPEAPLRGGERGPGFALDAAVGSALALDVSRRPVAMLGVGAERIADGWRLGLRGQVETPSDLDDSGTISIRHLPCELFVGADVYRAGELDAAVLLAGGVDVLSVQTSGYSRSGTRWLLEPNAGAGVRAEWRVLDELGLTTVLDTVVALRRERFAADQGTLARSPRVRARFSLGATWHLF